MASRLPECLIGVEAADIFQPTNLSLIRRHVDEVIADGLGNFMVFRAYRIVGDSGPETDLTGIKAVEDYVTLTRRLKARPVQAGSPAVEALRYACERGLWCASLYTSFTPDAVRQIRRECGERFLFPMLGEMWGGMGEEMGQAAEQGGAADLAVLDRRAVENMANAVRDHRRSGFARVGHVDAPIHHRLGYRAGLHVSMTELMCGFVPVHLAATRGAADAFGKDFGSWLAIGYFGGANADPLKPVRFRAALNSSFLNGARYILMESGQWGLHEFGNKVPEGNMLSREMRHELRRFYSFARRHPRPAARPEVRLGFVQGRYDGWSAALERVLWRQEHGGPEYLYNSAERGWDYLDVIWPGKGRCDDYPLQDAKTPWLLGSPYGPADIVPAEAPAARLARYKALMFLGWNSMDAALYRRLREYVRGGGTLFMAVPHLATWTRRPDQLVNPTDMKLIRNGRVEDLFGARVLRRGDYHDRINTLGVVSPGRIGLPAGRRFLMETALYPAIVEMRGGRVLARSHDRRPLLIENRLGGGTAYLFCIWEYPGINTYQEFMRELVGTFGKWCMGDIRVASTAAVEWAVYRGPEFAAVHVLNTHLERPALATVTASRGLRLDVQVDPGHMRIVYVLPDLALCFDSPLTALASAHRGRTWRLDIQGVEPLGVRFALGRGLEPRSVRFGDEHVKEFGFTYPYYVFHFHGVSGRLDIAARPSL